MKILKIYNKSVRYFKNQYNQYNRLKLNLENRNFFLLKIDFFSKTIYFLQNSI